jgi:hypothetical protein
MQGNDREFGWSVYTIILISFSVIPQGSSELNDSLQGVITTG